VASSRGSSSGRLGIGMLGVFDAIAFASAGHHIRH
jgi:hypothetical protein